MAKWGEGDPRWLVEQRPDATNVNNWHWMEKDASSWSRCKFAEIFIGAKIETDVGSSKILKILKCEGEASVNNRKAKLIFFYEWNLEMEWTGTVRNSNSEIKGKIEVNDFTEEHDIKEVDIRVHLNTNGKESAIIKELMEKDGVDTIRNLLSSYVLALKNEFGNDLILPTKENPHAKLTNSEKQHKREVSELVRAVESCKNKEFKTAELRRTESFKCTAEDFYRAMTIEQLVQAFTQGKCVLEPKEGGNFELFDGNVRGYFVELIPNKKIHQKWRFKTWPDNHFSDVVIHVNQKSDGTDVEIVQQGIPEDQLENTEIGWKKFYWDSMRKNLGFGALLF